MSLPLRERGLKYTTYEDQPDGSRVAPFAGAWIEILFQLFYNASVASLPLRERGLKYIAFLTSPQAVQRRSLCGSVD